MAGGDDKILRVRGGPKGFRMISLNQWKDEIRARKGLALLKEKSIREKRMEAKQRRRNESHGRKEKVKP